VAGKYARPEEVEFARRRVAGGLDPEEAALAARLFPPGSRVLDVGCGGGREAIALARLGCHVRAIDLVPAMIELARAEAAQAGVTVTFEVKSVTALDYLPGSFDHVLFSTNVYAYIPSRAGRIDTLRRVHTALREEGTLVFSAYNRPAASRGVRSSLRDLARRCLGWVPRNGRGPEPGDRWVRSVSGASGPDSPLCFCHHATVAEVTEEIRQAGFGLEEITTHQELVQGVELSASGRARIPTLIYIARKPRAGRGS
jgi:SAM-dependent methyltransferase